MHGILREKDEKNVQFSMGNYIIHVTYGNKEKPSYGLIIQEAEDEFIISGINFSVVFSTVDKNKKGSIGQVWEGGYEGNNWIPTRLLNGDDTGHNRVLRVSGRKIFPATDVSSVILTPAIYKVTLYNYEL